TFGGGRSGRGRRDAGVLVAEAALRARLPARFLAADLVAMMVAQLAAPPADVVLAAVALRAHRLLAAFDAAGRARVRDGGRRLLGGLRGLCRLLGRLLGGLRVGRFFGRLGGRLGGSRFRLLLFVFLRGHCGADNMRSCGSVKPLSGPAPTDAPQAACGADEPSAADADTGKQSCGVSYPCRWWASVH